MDQEGKVLIIHLPIQAFYFSSFLSLSIVDMDGLPLYVETGVQWVLSPHHIPLCTVVLECHYVIGGSRAIDGYYCIVCEASRRCMDIVQQLFVSPATLWLSDLPLFQSRRGSWSYEYIFYLVRLCVLCTKLRKYNLTVQFILYPTPSVPYLCPSLVNKAYY